MKIKSTTPALTWIIKAAGKAKWKVAGLSLIQVVKGLAAVAKTLLLGQAVNCVVSGDRQEFIYAVLIYIALVVLQITLGAVYRYLNELALAETENRLKARLLNALLMGNYGEVTRTHSGEWMNRLTSDTSVVSNAFVGTVPEVFGLPIRLVAALVAIAWLEPKFLLFLLAGGIIIVVLTRVFRKIMKRRHKDIREADGRLRVFLQERLGSMLIIKSFVQEKNTLKLTEDYMSGHKKTRMKRNAVLNIFYSGYSIGINGVYILGIVLCGFGILQGTMSYGSLVSILQLLEQVQGPFASFTGILPKYYSMIASAERLIEAENIETDVKGDLAESQQAFYENEFLGLGLKNATFTYKPAIGEENDDSEMQPVFQNLSLEISKGEHVAFTGPSGCGKSTVLKLLMNLYPLDSGEVYLLSKNGKSALAAERRRLFAYVPQGNQLLTGTIRECIAFGDEEEMKDEVKLQKALKIACADGFVNELEKGPDTMLGERGAGLSEGQMQRIAIARAIFSEHPILLLDEATSALDETTAAQMLNNLKTMTDKTVIMVTHRRGNMKTFSKEVTFSKNGVEVKDKVPGEATE